MRIKAMELTGRSRRYSTGSVRRPGRFARRRPADDSRSQHGRPTAHRRSVRQPRKESLLSSRVVLRAPTPRFEAAFLEASRRSRELHRRFAHPPLNSKAFRAFVRRAKQPAHESHLVFEARSRALVGVINLNEIVRGSFQSAYLGYYGFEPYAGRGLMTAGLALVLHRAFRQLGLHRVEANIQPRNKRSLALVRRLGFRREGFSPRYLKLGGQWQDHERWALLREEWRGLRVAA